MNETKIAVDIEELESEPILDAFLFEKGEVFKTARGRRAILIGTAALGRLRQQLSLRLEEGHDGNQVLKT
jgi:hypothetical protein